jgi:hypothetical protein
MAGPYQRTRIRSTWDDRAVSADLPSWAGDLGLQQHPEGGWYAETYRHDATTETANGTRALYGYTVGYGAVVAEEASLIREAARRVLAGEGVHRICRDWPRKAS